MAYQPKDTQERILHRLKIAKGHLQKVIEMTESGVYCIDILTQSQAVQSSLKQVDGLLLENHLRNCVFDAIGKGKKDDAIEEIMHVFKKKN